MRRDQMGYSFVVAKRARAGVGNIEQFAGIPLGIEGRDRRAVEKGGRQRIEWPFRARQRKPSRPGQRGIFDIADRGDAMCP